ncbi:MAG: 50S ribosomal protein L18 [Pseudomonadales bacterium]
MSKKRDARLKRAKKGRMHIRDLDMPRLCVYRSPRHIYAQVISPAGDRVQAAASSLDKAIRPDNRGNVKDAVRVGQLIAERAKAAGVEKVAFDRSGYKYHGRIKALADAAREGGLQF